MKLSLMAPLAMFAALAVALAVGLNREDAEELPSVFINQPSPEIRVGVLGGNAPYRAELLSAPGLKLVNFWASWCPPCRAEHPNLMQLANEGWTIIGINKSDEQANALGFLRELGNPYAAVGADPDGRASIEWGVYGLPETFLVDGAGHIRLRHPGPVTKRVWQSRFVPIIAALQAGG